MFFRRAWGLYEAQLKARPVLTKVAVASPMFAVTDVTVQCIEQQREARGAGTWQLSLRRTGAQALFGAYYAIVHAHFIWGRLEVLFARFGALTPFVGAFLRVCVDQFITGTPLFNTVFFYTTGRLGQGMDHAGAVANVEHKLWPMLQKHWGFWVPFHTLNFWLVPYRHRLVPATVALFGWSAFMSHAGAAKAPVAKGAAA